MKNTRKKSDFVKDAVDSIMSDFYEGGFVDELTMREYRALDLPTPKEYKAKEVVRVRKKLKVSQSVFARLLNSTPSIVRKWELGDRSPSGLANKLLYIAENKGIEGLV